MYSNEKWGQYSHFNLCLIEKLQSVIFSTTFQALKIADFRRESLIYLLPWQVPIESIKILASGTAVVRYYIHISVLSRIWFVLIEAYTPPRKLRNNAGFPTLFYPHQPPIASVVASLWYVNAKYSSRQWSRWHRCEIRKWALVRRT